MFYRKRLTLTIASPLESDNTDDSLVFFTKAIVNRQISQSQDQQIYLEVLNIIYVSIARTAQTVSDEAVYVRDVAFDIDVNTGQSSFADAFLLSSFDERSYRLFSEPYQLIDVKVV